MLRPDILLTQESDKNQQKKDCDYEWGALQQCLTPMLSRRSLSEKKTKTMWWKVGGGLAKNSSYL